MILVVSEISHYFFCAERGISYMGKKEQSKLLRLTEKDRIKLSEVSEKYGMNPSKYLRSCIYNRPNDHPEFRKNLAELTYEVHKIGVNINQIAYHSNIGFLTAKEKTLLLEQMKEVRQGILRLAEYGNHEDTSY